jgi:ATP-binding cassette subfamily C protein
MSRRRPYDTVSEREEAKRECSIESLFRKTLSYRKDILKGNLSAIGATLLTVIIPLFIPMLVDELILHKSDTLTGWVASHIAPMDASGYLIFFLLLVLLLRGLGFLLNTYQVRIFTSVSRKVSYSLRMDALKHLRKVSLAEYETSSPGSVASKLVTDIDTVESFIGTTVGKLIVSILTLLFSAIVLLMIDWKLALFILLTNPIVVYFTARLARNVGRLKREQNRAVELFQSSLSDTLELFHQIRATGKEDYFFGRIAEKAETLRDRSSEFAYRSDRAMRLSFLVFLGGYELFRSVSIFVAIYGDLSVGLMLAVFGYLWVMMTPTQDIINFQYALASARAACRRIETLFEMDTEPELRGGEDPFSDDGAVSIETKALSFSYGGEKRILHDIDISIEAGSKVAIVGPSGSGKTTLANLLVGLYPSEEGSVLYNGVESSRISPATIRANCHLILQNPRLFNETMRFNLTLGREYGDDEIFRAIEIAQLSEVVEEMPDGLDSVVGRDGIRLSGGQRQRVAIARMILIDPSVVVLDESTSALDIHTEVRLFDELRGYLADKTVVTIAHRLSTIEKAEKIIVLEDGRVVDVGKPEELLEREEGYFSKMV